MYDLSTVKAAMGLSSGVRERAFSIASHGHTLITPPSEPDHKSPGSKREEIREMRMKTNYGRHNKSFFLWLRWKTKLVIFFPYHQLDHSSLPKFLFYHQSNHCSPLFFFLLINRSLHIYCDLRKYQRNQTKAE